MPDYMFLLESRLSPEQRAAMMRVQELSAALGFNVYLTGGTVRDLITGASLATRLSRWRAIPRGFARELEKGGAKILVEDESCAWWKSCLPETAKAVFPRRGTTITSGRLRVPRFVGPPSWRTCGVAISR